MITLDTPLDLNDPQATGFLQGIQGNILKGHGRDHTAHIFVKMVGEPTVVRRWIAEFAKTHVTSADNARRQTAQWRATGDAGEPFAMFLLAPDGYRFLGYSDDAMPVPEGNFVGSLDQYYFKQGMKNQAQRPTGPGTPAEGIWRSYNDPPSSQWETPYQAEIHAMVLLADDSKERLEQSIKTISISLSGTFEILTVERGEKLVKTFPRGTLEIEHFGFQDGVSQPLMIKQDIEKEIAERGSTNWDPSAPLSLALVKDPVVEEGYGSFMVFRKLEQNVKSFWESLEMLSNQYSIPLDKAGAMAVGRFEDGTPVVPTVTIDPNAHPNDFHYTEQDPKGETCPFHAHIRKTNPRGDVPMYIRPDLAEFERARRIVRRGITYGSRPDLKGEEGAQRPSAGVGLLFMCFQSNLDQFVIQQEGSDGNGFVRPGTGLDAVIGQYQGNGEKPLAQSWPSGSANKFTMVNFVRMLGGEYFFAPSMAFLRNLGTD